MSKTDLLTGIFRKYIEFFAFLFFLLILWLIILYADFAGKLHAIGYNIGDISLDYALRSFDFGNLITMLPVLLITLIFFFIGEIIDVIRKNLNFSVNINHKILEADKAKMNYFGNKIKTLSRSIRNNQDNSTGLKKFQINIFKYLMRSGKFPNLDCAVRVILVVTFIGGFVFFCRHKFFELSELVKIENQNQFLWSESFNNNVSIMGLCILYSVTLFIFINKKRFLDFFFGTLILIALGVFTISTYSHSFQTNFNIFYKNDKSKIYNQVFCFKDDIFKNENCVFKDGKYQPNVRIIKDFGDKILIYINGHGELVEAAMISRRFAPPPEIKVQNN